MSVAGKKGEMSVAEGKKGEMPVNVHLKAGGGSPLALVHQPEAADAQPVRKKKIFFGNETSERIGHRVHRRAATTCTCTTCTHRCTTTCDTLV